MGFPGFSGFPRGPGMTWAALPPGTGFGLGNLPFGIFSPSPSPGPTATLCPV